MRLVMKIVVRVYCGKVFRESSVTIVSNIVFLCGCVIIVRDEIVIWIYRYS